MRCQLAIFLALALCGCGILEKEPYRKVSLFDFSSTVAKQDVKNGGVAISEVTADKPYFERMVFRVSPNRIEVDEYNRWAGSPADLIRNHLTEAFQPFLPVESAKYYSLGVRLVRLEADLKQSTVYIALRVVVNQKLDNHQKTVLFKVYTQELPVEKVTGESFARSVEVGLDKIAAEIAQDIQKIQ